VLNDMGHSREVGRCYVAGVVYDGPCLLVLLQMVCWRDSLGSTWRS